MSIFYFSCWWINTFLYFRIQKNHRSYGFTTTILWRYDSPRLDHDCELREVGLPSSGFMTTISRRYASILWILWPPFYGDVKDANHAYSPLFSSSSGQDAGLLRPSSLLSLCHGLLFQGKYATEKLHQIFCIVSKCIATHGSRSLFSAM